MYCNLSSSVVEQNRRYAPHPALLNANLTSAMDRFRLASSSTNFTYSVYAWAGSARSKRMSAESSLSTVITVIWSVRRSSSPMAFPSPEEPPVIIAIFPERSDRRFYFLSSAFLEIITVAFTAANNKTTKIIWFILCGNYLRYVDKIIYVVAVFTG